MQVVPEIHRYDPARLQRYLLKDPQSPSMQVPLPKRKKMIVPKGYMAHYLAVFCQSGGIAVGVNDFLFRPRRRQVEGEEKQYSSTALMKQPSMLRMYTLLYFGHTPKSFLDLLHSWGWWSIYEQGPPLLVESYAEPAQSKRQQDLFP